MSIQASGVSKSFGNRRVLRSLDFTAQDGEVIALIGSNGVGKTTLLRILAGLMKPDSGKILINGATLDSQSTLVRRSIGAVLHAPMLYPNLTAEENLQFFHRLYALPFQPSDITGLLSIVSLEKRGKDLVRTFSRGMQQRLSIARTLVHDPAVMLMDEPYTGLDQDSSSWLDKLLRDFAARGKTILFTTHDLERSLDVATRVDILHRGAIARSFSSSELTPGKLTQTYREINSPPTERIMPA